MNLSKTGIHSLTLYSSCQFYAALCGRLVVSYLMVAGDLEWGCGVRVVLRVSLLNTMIHNSSTYSRKKFYAVLTPPGRVLCCH
jgi:hypothetical protein